MEFLIWMAIGIALMAVELVIPGGILGLIGYCAFLWGVFVALGEGTVALYAVLGLTALLIVLIIVFFNHFEKTWIGKLFTLGQRSTTKAGYVSNDVLEDLAGKEGFVITDHLSLLIIMSNTVHKKNQIGRASCRERVSSPV